MLPQRHLSTCRWGRGPTSNTRSPPSLIRETRAGTVCGRGRSFSFPFVSAWLVRHRLPRGHRSRAGQDPPLLRAGHRRVPHRIGRAVGGRQGLPAPRRAHLGGGHVKGECLRCPFHDWGFRTDGVCVDVPYAPKIPPKAAVKTWHIREQNGVILAWYCPKGEAPAYEVPVLEEEGLDRQQDGAVGRALAPAGGRREHRRLLAPRPGPPRRPHRRALGRAGGPLHARRPPHGGLAARRSTCPTSSTTSSSTFKLYGIGHIVSLTTVLTSDMRTRQRIYPTPIDEDTIAIFGVSNIKQMADEGYTHEIEDIFVQSVPGRLPQGLPDLGEQGLPRQADARRRRPPDRSLSCRWCRQFYDYPEDPPAGLATAAPGVLRRPCPADHRASAKLKGLACAPSSRPAAANNGNGGSNGTSDSNNNDGEVADMPS